jgi:exopolyphosphatase/guanosine-5'-triphosphate,3'-diphosphate pyrophosphatase
MQALASIDVGSNTLRLLISEPAVFGSFRPIQTERRITRLGENFLPEKTLQLPAIERSISALQEFVELMQRRGVSQYLAGATAVVREASNGRSFLEQVRARTGLRVSVLSGSEEARLSLLGVASVIPDSKTGMAIFDIGGGSTELVWKSAEKGDALESSSMPVGVVHLTETFLPQDPPGSEACAKLRRYVSSILSGVVSFPGTGNTTLWVGTAGTVTTLASMWLELPEYDPGKINGTVLERRWLADLCAELAQMKIAHRSKLPGLEPGREDIILAGGLVTLELMDTFGFCRFTVSDAGVLEGLLLDLCANLTGSRKEG